MQAQVRAAIALREVSRLLAELTQAHRRRAPIALREVTPLLAAAKRLIAIVEQHQSPVFALWEVSLLLAPAQRLRVQIAVQAPTPMSLLPQCAYAAVLAHILQSLLQLLLA